jgi:cell division protein FtsA
VEQAEEIKKQHGYAIESDVIEGEEFSIRPFGQDEPIQISRRELALIIEARVEEIINMVVQEIKRSGYDGLLPAGMVLTGGTSALPGIRALASRVLGLPVRLAQPENLIGMTDRLHGPAYSTSVGLLHWALLMTELGPGAEMGLDSLHGGVLEWENIKSLLRRLLP